MRPRRASVSSVCGLCLPRPSRFGGEVLMAGIIRQPEAKYKPVSASKTPACLDKTRGGYSNRAGEVTSTAVCKLFRLDTGGSEIQFWLTGGDRRDSPNMPCCCHRSVCRV